jgi:hypothetical protein
MIETGNELTTELGALLSQDPPKSLILKTAARALEQLQTGRAAVLLGVSRGEAGFEAMKDVGHAVEGVLSVLRSVIEFEEGGRFRDNMMDLPEASETLRQVLKASIAAEASP